MADRPRALRRHTLKLAVTAMLAALLTGGKFVLAAIPNVEIVTLLCALYGYTFGWTGIAATYLFVVIESLLWGVQSWVLTYVLYWPFVAFIFYLLGGRVSNRWILTAVACVLTVWFGVLSSLVDTGLFTGFFDRFFYRFSIIYVRGVAFYVTQIVCNAVLFPIAFIPLHRRLSAMLPVVLFRKQPKAKPPTLQSLPPAE